jgi:hypothetical protein
VKYVPEWMPGASFKRKAREWRGVAERFYTILFDFVKQSMADGTVKSSFTSLALRDITENDDRKYQEELIKGRRDHVYWFVLGSSLWSILRHGPTAGADTVRCRATYRYTAVCISLL